MVNLELLDKVHKFIKRNPYLHDQGDFANGYAEFNEHVTDQNQANECGTTMCFAGWTAILSGHLQIRGRNIENRSEVVDPSTGRVRSMHIVAIDELNLGYEQWNELFFEAQSMEEVDNVVERIHNGTLN